MVVMTGSVTFATSQDTWQETAGSGEVVHPLQANPGTDLEEEVEIKAAIGSMEPAITVESMVTKRQTVGNWSLMLTSALVTSQEHQEMR